MKKPHLKRTYCSIATADTQNKWISVAYESDSSKTSVCEKNDNSC